MIKKQLLHLSLISLLSITAFSNACAYTTDNGKIYDKTGTEVLIDGVAWIGFQDSNFLGGLWNTGLNATGAEHGIMELLKSPWNVPGSNITAPEKGVSFKTIRLPIQAGIWHDATQIQQNPFDFSHTSINDKNAGNGPFCDWTQGADGSGHCKQSKTAPELLKATIGEFNKQNIRVMLDFHHRPGLGDQFRDGTVVASDYSLKNYYEDINQFAKTAQPNVLGIDIYNEPHKLYWYEENKEAKQPSWIKVIAAAAAAAYKTNPDLLLFVEGPGGTAGNDQYDPVFNQDRAICLPAKTEIHDKAVVGLANDPEHCGEGTIMQRVSYIGSNWGENFRSLLDPIQAKQGVAHFDTATFKAKLIEAIRANNFDNNKPELIAEWLLGKNNDGKNGHIVFAPHLYGKKVAGWQSDANDSKVRFKWNFGFLQESGFPVVIGELGFDAKEGGEDFFNDSVASYLIDKKINHNLFFWTWNFSDDPVGIRDNDSGIGLYAWKELDLHNLFNAIAPVKEFGKLCISVPTPEGFTDKKFPTIHANGEDSYTFNLSNFDKLLCADKVTTGTYTLIGSTLQTIEGISYIPKQQYTASVTKNTETDSVIEYIKESTGKLSLSVAGDNKCILPDTQSFTVTYAKGAISKKISITKATPTTIDTPVGSYTITVTPETLPTQSECKAKFDATVNITENKTTQDNITFSTNQPTTCEIDAQCNTWGTPKDDWAGSSCNFFIHTKSPLSIPTTVKMDANGISEIQPSPWGAKVTLAEGKVVLALTDPVYNINAGFNAKGIINLPTQAILITNGQPLVCNIVKK